MTVNPSTQICLQVTLDARPGSWHSWRHSHIGMGPQSGRALLLTSEYKSPVCLHIEILALGCSKSLKFVMLGDKGLWRMNSSRGF